MVAVALTACRGVDSGNSSPNATASKSAKQRTVKALVLPATAAAPTVLIAPFLETMRGVTPPDPSGTEDGIC